MADKTIQFITEYDPEVGKAMAAELARQRRGIELDRLRKFCFRGCDGSHGKHFDQ